LATQKKACESYKVFFRKKMAQSRLILRKNKLKSPNLDHSLLLGYRQNSGVFIFQLCNVAQVVIIHKYTIFSQVLQYSKI
jgi:hypothetical protein